MNKSIENYNLSYVDIDASKKFRVIVYTEISDPTNEIFLCVPRAIYEEMFGRYISQYPLESAMHSELRTVEHFMLMHGVIDTLFINTIPDFHLVDLESETKDKAQSFVGKWASFSQPIPQPQPI